MPGPLVGPLVGAGIGFLGSIFGSKPKVAGVDPLTNEAIANWRNIVGYGNQGFEALSGDTNAMNRFMNPYSETMNPFWDRLRSRGLADIGSRATMQGAFGGSRHGAVEGSFLGDAAIGQAGQRYGEFDKARQIAQFLASQGADASGNLFGAGDYLRNVRQQQLSRQYKNPFGAALGGAMIGSSLFPGGGGIPGAPNTSGFDPNSVPPFNPACIFGGC